MKALVTGGAGFIGSHLVTKLIDDGYAVTVVDRRASWENLQGAGRFIQGMFDVRKIERIRPSMEGIDVVFHLAADISVDKSMRLPLGTYENNVFGTAIALLCASAVGVRRFVNVSSSAVYGDARGRLAEGTRIAPISPYGASKAASELLCKDFIGNTEVTTVRPFNVYGPRQQKEGPYASVVSSFMFEETPTIYGDGEQSRSFLHVDDMVDLLILLATNPRAAGETFNAGGPRAYTVNEVFDITQRARGNDGEEATPIHEEARPGDIKMSEADNSKVRSILGFIPRIELEDGVRGLVQ